MKILALAMLVSLGLASSAALACSMHVEANNSGSGVVAQDSGQSSAPMTKFKQTQQQGS